MTSAIPPSGGSGEVQNTNIEGPTGPNSEEASNMAEETPTISAADREKLNDMILMFCVNQARNTSNKMIQHLKEQANQRKEADS